jgi:glycolate oxidase
MTAIPMPAPDAALVSRRDSLIKALGRILPADSLVTGAAGRRVFEATPFPGCRCLPLAAILPESTYEVSETARFCRTSNVGIITRGGGTSPAGGALPLADSIVVCLSRMNRVLDVNLASRTLRAEAGITCQDIAGILAPLNCAIPAFTGSPAATAGGVIAANLASARSLKYGPAASSLLGLKMVLAGGDVIELGGGYSDAAGYDLCALTAGSEGQYGIITEVTLRIQRLPEGTRTMLLAFGSIEAAANCAAAVIGASIIPAALELMDKTAMQIGGDYAKAPYPRDAEAVLIVEAEGADGESGAMLDAISQIAAPFSPASARITAGDKETAAIWAGRHAISGAGGGLAAAYCADGAVPLPHLAVTLKDAAQICRGYGLRSAITAHAGDGRFQVHIVFDSASDEDARRAAACGADILKLCAVRGGSLTAGHGAGIQKRDLLPAQYSPSDLDQQMRVKRLFDPQWRLNPGKVFPLPSVAAFMKANPVNG